MHARVGIYKVKPGTLDDTIAKARAELLPKMREQPGLKRYTVVLTGPESFVSLSAWDTREQAEKAAETLSGWVKENVGPSVVSMENHIGEVVLLHGQTAPDKTPKYGMVRVSTPKPDAPALTEKVRAEFMPLHEQQPGFNMFTTIVTDGGEAHLVRGMGLERSAGEGAADPEQMGRGEHSAAHGRRAGPHGRGRLGGTQRIAEVSRWTKHCSRCRSCPARPAPPAPSCASWRGSARGSTPPRRGGSG